jgi:Xaa-Pro aminopeptidase
MGQAFALGFARMPLDPQIFAARRAAAVARMRERGGGVLLVPAADEKIRSNDSEFLFRQDSDFYYLTGLDEPQGCLVLHADPPAGRPAFVLFVRPRDKEREIWNGRRVGVEGAKSLLGADAAFSVEEQDAKLAAQLDGEGPLWYRLGPEPHWDARVGRTLVELRGKARTGARAPLSVCDHGPIVHELRLLKSPEELDRLREAAKITDLAHRAAMRVGRPGAFEYTVQAEIEHAFRVSGGRGPGYGTIVAAGGNSCILHYRAGDRELRAGEVCLVDAGGELDFYTADVTRTFPVSGKFSPAQRDLYQVTLEAQLAGITAVKPGCDVEEIHRLAVRRLTQGMIDLKLLSGGVDDRIADESYKRYYMHRTSHWLGMDVHDVGLYQVAGKPRPFAPGMVLTVEPGFYVPEDDEKAPPEMRGVGIRIEDDILVTAGGNENLTRAIPKTVPDVEAACAR